MDLSKRMQAVAQAVSPCHKMADIGTDHGYVPIYLVKKGVCEYAFAMDVNKGPLERASQNIRMNGLKDKIETRLSDGMDKLREGEADAVVIAGMGGDLMRRIIDSPVWMGADYGKNRPELVLQPQAENYKVRHWLHEHAYAIVDEWFLMDEGKYYVVIKAQPCDQPVASYEKEESYLYGHILIQKKDAVLKEYLLKEADKKLSLMENLSRIPKQSARVEELRGEYQAILNTLQMYGEA